VIDVEVTCEGLKPLLMNPATEELLNQLRNKTPSPKRTDWSPEDEARTKLYRDVDGRVGIPALNLNSCLIEAGRMVKNGAKQLSTAKSTIIPSFLSINSLFLPFNGDPKWVADMRRGRNPNGGEMVVLVRPRFDDWSFDFTLEVDDDEINLNVVRSLVETAGKKVGLCDFRPACKGPFGRFAVTKWAPLDGTQNGHASANARELVTH
jgi:hypothetical protein